MMRTFASFAVALGVLAALAPGRAEAQRTIVIDPGHGGNDPGGVGTGLQEKAIVLDVSRRFAALLDADTADPAGGGAWSTSLTRSADTTVSLAARSAYANASGADRFLSIHSNAFGDPAANGTETFSYADTGPGAALRNLVQAEMIAAWGLTNRGNKTADFAVLRETAAPAVLHELAFITNATDAAKLASADERQKAAIAHLRALQRHYGIAPYVPMAPPTDERGELIGRVVDDLGPIANAVVRIDTGEERVTGEDGAFAFPEVAAGARTLAASAEGHEPRAVELAVASGARAELELELVRLPGGEP
ncbi:MAG TPA: N-acetylmuramoyl-L-alanine amidase, partial [Kofleriaceae bacterium]|nr:N-acetylmuramoyl-L-alanine amidase [Kofleriaceae bacterium]